MTKFGIKTASPDFEPGTYEMLCVNIVEKMIASTMGRTAGTDQPMLEWTWGDPDDDQLDISMLTSFIISPKSRLNECLLAVLGAEETARCEQAGTFDTADCIGKRALVTIIVNEKGYNKIDHVTALPTRRTVRQTVAQNVAPDVAPTANGVAAAYTPTPAPASAAQPRPRGVIGTAAPSSPVQSNPQQEGEALPF